MGKSVSADDDDAEKVAKIGALFGGAGVCVYIVYIDPQNKGFSFAHPPHPASPP